MGKNLDEYEPFGEEWVKEMKKFSKGALVEMLRDSFKNNLDLKRQLEK